MPVNRLTPAVHPTVRPPLPRQRYDIDPRKLPAKASPSRPVTSSPLLAALLADSSPAPPRPRSTLINASLPPTDRSTSVRASTSHSAPLRRFEWQSRPLPPSTDPDVLTWNPLVCHQLVSQAYPDPAACVLCFVRTGSHVYHRDEATRRIPCPRFDFAPHAWESFVDGWEAGQLPVVNQYRAELIDNRSHSYCGNCRIEVCWERTHNCVFYDHDQIACPFHRDQDRRWLLRLTYIALCDAYLRQKISTSLLQEDTSNWDSHRWGFWVSAPQEAHLSRATVVVSLYLEHFGMYHRL